MCASIPYQPRHSSGGGRRKRSKVRGLPHVGHNGASGLQRNGFRTEAVPSVNSRSGSLSANKSTGRIDAPEPGVGLPGRYGVRPSRKREGDFIRRGVNNVSERTVAVAVSYCVRRCRCGLPKRLPRHRVYSGGSRDYALPKTLWIL